MLCSMKCFLYICTRKSITFNVMRKICHPKFGYMRNRLVEYCRINGYVFEIYCNGAVMISSSDYSAFPFNSVFPSLYSAYRSIIVNNCRTTPIFYYDYMGESLPF